MLTAGIGGVSGTGLDLGVLVVLVGRHVPIPLATFIAALAGAATSFTLNKYVAFRDRSPLGLGQIVRFDLVAVVGALLVAAAMKLATANGVPLVAAKLACAALVFAIWTFPAQRHLVFPAKPKNAGRLPPVAVTLKRSLAMSNPALVDLSLVIPAFNEERRLLPTLERLHAHLSAQPLSYEILVVDDGSRDKTCEVVEAAAATLPNVILVRQRPNRGKGAAVRRGMLAAHGRIRVMWDADSSMPPEELPRLLAPIVAERAEIAIGSRYAEGAKTVKQPRYRVLWSRLCNKVIQRWLVPRVLDTQCGFKAFTSDAARSLFASATIDGWAFDLEILALAHRRGFALEEVGVAWKDDERSRVNPFTDFWKVIREALTIRRNLDRGVYATTSAEGPQRHGGCTPLGLVRRSVYKMCPSSDDGDRIPEGHTA
jgi:dolichyl-phosphate beta-glucosyltransferase